MDFSNAPVIEHKMKRVCLWQRFEGIDLCWILDCQKRESAAKCNQKINQLPDLYTHVTHLLPSLMDFLWYV